MILAVVALVRTALVIVGATVGAATTTKKNVRSDSNNALRTLIINYEKDRRQP